MTSKKAFFERVVAELNLDTRDPYTLLMANACALVDQRDELQRELAEAKARLEFVLPLITGSHNGSVHERLLMDQFLRGLEGVAAIDNARKGKGEGS